WNELCNVPATTRSGMLEFVDFHAMAPASVSGGASSGTGKPMSWRTPSVSCSSNNLRISLTLSILFNGVWYRDKNIA
nr:hypothetical protein [Candidatus Sigynarchaeota archaeon]